MKSKEIEAILFNEDLEQLDGKTQLDYDMAADWKAATDILDKLAAEGKLRYEADNPRKPFILHSITIHWNFDNNGFVEMDAKEIADVVSKTGSLLIDEDGAVWQLTQRLHKRVSD